jgi:hypothetical protein
VLRALELDDALGRERNLLALNIGHLRECVRVYVRASSDGRRERGRVVSYVRETMSHRRPWLRMHRWRADESVVECGE